MSLHHGPTDLCDNHFTVSFILLWFQAPSQASLRFCLRANLTSKTGAYAAKESSGQCFIMPRKQCSLNVDDHEIFFSRMLTINKSDWFDEQRLGCSLYDGVWSLARFQ